ncbi:hypothetical protein [Spongorhabdus nitratireducens]
MTRKSTTREFRERAVSMVMAGKSTEEVAEELLVEHHKVRRWFTSATKATVTSSAGLSGSSQTRKQQSSPRRKKCAVQKDFDKERLLQENRYLKELVHLSSLWISVYAEMQTEYQPGQ